MSRSNKPRISSLQESTRKHTNSLRKELRHDVELPDEIGIVAFNNRLRPLALREVMFERATRTSESFSSEIMLPRLRRDTRIREDTPDTTR